MGRDAVFVSYARQQFNFAESLVMALERAGVETWFDMHRLSAGADWRERIDGGLDEARAVVLVASRAALASEYVRREWRAALAANKPVYVVFFEPVRLPAELASASCFDFRWRFDHHVAALARALRTNKPARDRAPWPNPLRVPTRLPGAVAIMLVALAVAALCLLGCAAVALVAVRAYLREAAPDAGLAYDPLAKLLSQRWLAIGVLLSWAALTVRVIYTAWAVLYRQFRWRYLRALLLFLPLGLAAMLFMFAVLAAFLTSGYTVGDAVLYPDMDVLDQLATPLLIATVLCWTAYYSTGRSADVLRWLPTGEAPESLRERLNGRILLDADARPSRGVETYGLYFDPADERVAAAVMAAMDAGGARQEERPERPVDCHIAILSNKTPRDQLDRLAAVMDGPIVCVVAASVALPDDAALVHRYQWVDYRGRDASRLPAMAQRLCRGAYAQYAYAVVPESLAKPVTPQSISTVAHALRVTGALNLAAGLLAAMLFVRPDLRAAATSGMPDGRTLMGLAVAVALFWLAGRVLTRDISLGRLALTTIVILVGMVAGGIYQGIASLAPPSSGAAGCAVIVWLGVPIAALLFGSQSLGLWLPLRDRRPAGRTLGVRPSLALWLPASYVLLAAELTLLLLSALTAHA